MFFKTLGVLHRRCKSHRRVQEVIEVNDIVKPLIRCAKISKNVNQMQYIGPTSAGQTLCHPTCQNTTNTLSSANATWNNVGANASIITRNCGKCAPTCLPPAALTRVMPQLSCKCCLFALGVSLDSAGNVILLWIFTTFRLPVLRVPKQILPNFGNIYKPSARTTANSDQLRFGAPQLSNSPLNSESCPGVYRKK